MKLIQKLNPKYLFRTTRKPRSITRSASSSSSSSSLTNPTTPNSVLPSRRELELLLTRVGPDPLSEEELHTMLADHEINDDDDGLIEKLGSTHDLREAFEYYDADKDGKISAQELLEALVSMGDAGCTLEECRRMIAGVDSDGDGFVCFQDFSRMMMVECNRSS